AVTATASTVTNAQPAWSFQDFTMFKNLRTYYRPVRRRACLLLRARTLDEVRELLERVDRRELVVVDRRQLVADRVALHPRGRPREERQLLHLAGLRLLRR